MIGALRVKNHLPSQCGNANCITSKMRNPRDMGLELYCANADNFLHRVGIAVSDKDLHRLTSTTFLLHCTLSTFIVYKFILGYFSKLQDLVFLDGQTEAKPIMPSGINSIMS